MARTRKKPPPRLEGPIRPPSVKSHRSPLVVERRELAGVVYQLEWVKCGTSTCHCMLGSDGHGPYWYGYKLARPGGGKAGKGGRWVSVYIGGSFHEI